MPIYVSYDSSDVWAHTELFQLDGEKKMQVQSGCPPCEFNKEGQVWENPLYDWEAHEKNNFNWFWRSF